jgi:hypothetical protein
VIFGGGKSNGDVFDGKHRFKGAAFECK